jgi:hypothetical protein
MEVDKLFEKKFLENGPRSLGNLVMYASHICAPPPPPLFPEFSACLRCIRRISFLCLSFLVQMGFTLWCIFHNCRSKLYRCLVHYHLFISLLVYSCLLKHLFYSHRSSSRNFHHLNDSILAAIPVVN